MLRIANPLKTMCGENAGATKKIIDYIQENRLLTK